MKYFYIAAAVTAVSLGILACVVAAAPLMDEPAYPSAHLRVAR